jgi:hypothetical protein
VCARALEVADHLVVLGDHVYDLHLKVGERVRERPNPAMRLARDLPAGDLVNRVELPLVDYLDEPMDEALVVVVAQYGSVCCGNG